jgi:hypothetical protein
MSCKTSPKDLYINPNQQITTFNSKRFCNELSFDPNEEKGITSNQALTGHAHPRTKIPPVIISRPYDYEYWQDSPMNVVSRVNKRTMHYPSLSGYNVNQLVDREWVGLESPHDDQAIYTSFNNPLIQTLQPGVYTNPNPADYDPINANLGITETPQFEPIKEIIMPTLQGDGTMSENVLFNQNLLEGYSRKKLHEQQLQMQQIQNGINESNEIEEAYEPIVSKQPIQEVPNLYNIYDPRFSGYGSQNRNYIEPMVNQPRYFYDDINSIRMPNYLVRSKIDSCVTSFGDTYGPMKRDQLTLNETRPLAEKFYLDNNLNFRNDMMESLMRKRNSELWQLRQAPKNRGRQPVRRLNN